MFPDAIAERSCDNAVVHSLALSFRRRERGRVLAGVAGGFADQHGVDALVVRGALVILAFAGGVGLAIYALMAIAAEFGHAVAPAHAPDRRRNAAVGCVALGVTLLIRSTGLWLDDAAMVPLIVIVAGVVVLGVVRDGPDGQAARPALTAATDLLAGRHARWRVVGGSALIALGLIFVSVGGGISSSVRVGVIATAISILGVAVLLGPWLSRLAQEAADERRQRIRSEERAAMAEHLHDSVLQTLALIQRSADDPRRTVTLARQQEHELRSWLYGHRSDSAETLSSAVRDLTVDIEGRYDVRLDVVVVGDRTMDDDLRALCGALREACVNAAKHSGTTSASVYVEVQPDHVEAFVRDRGVGFDRRASTTDVATGERRGITQSIEARLERVGGNAVIDSRPGAGTEVRLRVPLSSPAADATVASS